MSLPYRIAMWRWRAMYRLSDRANRVADWLQAEADFAEPAGHVRYCAETAEPAGMTTRPAPLLHVALTCAVPGVMSRGYTTTVGGPITYTHTDA